MTRIDVKPLTHWAIYKGYTLRFRRRTPQRVDGVLTDAAGIERAFVYAPDTLVLELPGERVRLNAYGWELERQALAEAGAGATTGAGVAAPGETEGETDL